MIRVGINGFGRIGRCVLRAGIESGRDDIVINAINSRSDISIARHLLKYDTTHGALAADVQCDNDNLIINGRRIRYTCNTDIDNIDWGDVDIVLECAGVFNNKQDAMRHIKKSTRRVVVSAPCKDADATIVYGVNHQILEKHHQVISAASCTTNCLAPIAHTLHNRFGIVNGWMSTIHAMTSDQKLLDESHKDLRRARAAGANIIPTKTGAADAIGLIIPELQGKLSGYALRVPAHNVSLIDLTCELATDADVHAINQAFIEAAAELPNGVMAISDEPLVSSDFNHNVYSSIIDTTQTRIMGRLVKVMAWYDNEWGFSNRMNDVAVALFNE